MAEDSQQGIQRRLSAILSADAVGYSRLMGDDDVATVRILSICRALIAEIVTSAGGRVVDSPGDNILTEFVSAVDAVKAASAIQIRLGAANIDLPEDRQMAFRIGVSLGDVLVEGDRIYGDGVNVAARLESHAEPGGILISSAVYDQVCGKVAFDFADLGEMELKNIPRRVRVYSLGIGTLAAPSPASVMRLSIVVLPFTNLSNDPSQEYFADGVTENLTTDLSRIRNSFVIGRNTAFTYKGKHVDLKQIGRELGVRYVLEGSVQRGGSRMRVNVQLIDTKTGAHLWAERFEEDTADLFELQDHVVARLANTLDYELVKAEAKRSARSKNPDAIDLTMRGWASLWQEQPPTKDSNLAARAWFDKALKIDPSDADALAGDAYTYMHDYRYGWSTAETDYDAKIIGQADRAIAFAPDNVLAYRLKSAYLYLSNRAQEALAAADAGLAVNPNYSPLYAARGSAQVSLGRFEQSKSDILQAMRLSPRDPAIGMWHVNLGDAELGLGHFDAAIGQYHKAIAAGNRTFIPYVDLAAAYALLGKMDEAKSALAEARRLNPKLTIKWHRAHAPNLPPLFEGARKAGLPEE